MKKLTLSFVLISIAFYSFGQYPNILLDLNPPTNGISLRMNFPGYTGGWARGFYISNENTTPHFGIGAFGYVSNGITTFDRGWIGKDYDIAYMNFLPNGNIGIGTNIPNEKLSVNGNVSVNGKIGAKEVKVEAKDWPDYVFAKDYVLPSLAETEKHIKEKGHLPGIPSATDVKTNGIELGEMNAKLLKKIEELTLYIIDLEKRVKTIETKK